MSAIDEQAVAAILSAMRLCYKRASTVASIAKATGLAAVTKHEVQLVVDALDGLSYAKVLRSASGRIAGLDFLWNAKGCCGEQFNRRSPGEIFYAKDGQVVAHVPENDLPSQKAHRAELQAYAQANGMPFFSEREHEHVDSAAPFVAKAVNEAQASASKGSS